MLGQIIIIALFSFGWVTSFSKGHIFEKIGDYLENKLPEKLYKPLVGCGICNAFWSGTAIYWWIFEGDDWRHWLLICLGAVGFNAMIVGILNQLEEIAHPREE